MREPHPYVPAANRLALVAMAVGALLLGVAATPADANLDFECEPVDCTFSGPDTLDAYITLDASVTDMKGFALQLEFDSTIITPVAVEKVDLLDGACLFTIYPTVGTDILFVDGAGLGCSVAGPGRMLRVRFTGVNYGESPFGCIASILRNSTNGSIAHTCGETTIYYVNPVPVQPATWTRLKMRY